MTREEAIKYIRFCMCEGRLVGNTKPIIDEKWQAGIMAIKALEQEPCEDATLKDIFCMGCEYKEQEPCEDAVSRQAAKRALEDRFMELQKRHDDKRYETNYCLNTILELPSITQQKIGHWEQYGNSWEDKFKCSECGKEQPKILCGERIIGHWSDYCPNCGAKMKGGAE